MDFIIEEFATYKVFLHSGEKKATAAMYIPLPSGKAVIKFAPNSTRKNTTIRDKDKTIYKIYVDDRYYPNFIDLLRNEKPLFFYYNFKTGESYITSSDEPVGEAEGDTDA